MLFQCLYQLSAGPRSTRCWLWNLPRTGLLAGEELLGKELGHGRVHYDVEEQQKPVWNRLERQLPSCLMETCERLKIMDLHFFFYFQ